MIYEFSENNSGGSWWLNKADYEALRDAGWKEPPPLNCSQFASILRSLDTKDVPYSWRHGWTFEANSLREAVESWEKATGKDFFEQGCNCCGAPFSIHTTGDGPYSYISGDSIERTPIRPW